MASEPTDGTGGGADRTTPVTTTAVRLVGDLLAVTGWVVLLALFFLQSTWPRWAFYALLIGGVGLYVTVTAAWRTTGRS
ncbi:hypothetical protein [Natronorubrum aibiense]|uniref:DUF8119 domain-containing protein n=1 Tax=Natronorubrum aibiense TaxID=348826 RepID=A0A5P9P512_9EURY|nr:hypothetical protein [Natronorubrum aibiense]QFU83245.1 hypothetical protein GCU68_12225 [Natronorubrum aibiense]